MKAKKPTYHERTNKYLDARLARFSDTNRPAMAEFVAAKRNEGIKPKSIYGYVQALGHLDVWLEGTAFKDVAPEQLGRFLTSLRDRQLAEHTVFGYVFKIRAYLRIASDLDKLPRSIRQALKVRQPREQFVGRLISDDEFRMLLEATTERGGIAGTLFTQEESQAILWLLWDCGHRAQELLSLKVGSLRFDGPDGVQVALDPSADGLKTGARTVYAALCARALRTWLAVHPRAGDAKAPLFPLFRDRTGTLPLTYHGLLQHLHALGGRSGANAGSARAKRISPHDFRHTAATRDARNGWNESQLCQKYGWTAGSKMPAHYVHLSLGDQRERARRDAGVDNLGFRPTNATDPAQALADLIRQLANQKAAPAPPLPDWNHP